MGFCLCGVDCICGLSLSRQFWLLLWPIKYLQGYFREEKWVHPSIKWNSKHVCALFFLIVWDALTYKTKHTSFSTASPNDSPKMRLVWNKPGYCLNKLGSVQLRQLKTIRVTFSGAGSIQCSLLVLHQIACGGLWLLGWQRPWWREIVTRMLMQQAAISERGCSESQWGAVQDQRWGGGERRSQAAAGTPSSVCSVRGLHTPIEHDRAGRRRLHRREQCLFPRLCFR